MNIRKGKDLKGIWLNKNEKEKLISLIEGNYKEELVDLIFKIYKRDKESFLK
jgi:hypothetical protein